MRNPKLKGLVQKFAKEISLGGNDADNFQKYINYLVFNKYYYDRNGVFPYKSLIDETFLSNIDFDKDDCGMAVDGCFALSEESFIHLDMDDSEMENVVTNMKGKTIHVVLIQTKSGNFEPNALSTLSTCLNSHFKNQDSWAKFVKLRGFLEKALENDHRTRIVFTTIYVCGNILDSKLFNNPTFKVRETDLQSIMTSYLWSDQQDTHIEYWGENEILEEIERQEGLMSAHNCTLRFSTVTNSIKCKDYGEIRFGVISVSELLKLLVNQETNRPYELYNYNVRDKIENSLVNDEIIDSLYEKSDYFLLLNNGITLIVDHEHRKTDDCFYLENIRIVNGCQTCHSIIEASRKREINGDALVAIRIVTPQKEDLLGEITYSSNRQNPVTKANLFAIAPEIVSLEKSYKDFFITNQSTPYVPVSLERRQGQFSGNSTDYIDIMAQAKAYTALWRLSPHLSIQYNEQILADYKKSLDKQWFIEKSLFCGIVWNTIARKIETKDHNARYHIFTIVALEILEVVGEYTSLQSALESINGEEIIKRLINCNKSMDDCINRIIEAIDSVPEKLQRTKNTNNIHYRRFYPAEILPTIYAKYIQGNL